MTVRYLWNVLEEAGCGSMVGIQHLISISRKKLAVDISIWICEALTSTALTTFHSNPAAYLVFQRTVTLLKLGIKIVAVLEGQGNRMLKNEGLTSFNSKSIPKTQRETVRDGGKFWEACASCAEILSSLGLPVLYAESNGEGLCALLNGRGLVDGVISNDGDCLLYGATNVYTNLSNESLHHGTAIKYDVSTLFTTISDEKLSLSRQDLIAFAILTGSDETGSGVTNVGAQKAIRLIYLLKKNDPRGASDAALNEIQKWSSMTNDEKTIGEGCGINRKIQVSFPESCDISQADRKFIQSICNKASTNNKGFNPEPAIQEYLCPNQGIIPEISSLLHQSPNFDKLMTTKVLVKGKSTQMSQEYMQAVLLKLSARLIVLRRSDDDCERNRYYKTFPSNKELVEPRHIVKKCQHKGISCYEVLWNREALEFNTFEWEHSFNKAFPTLVELFNEKERLGQQLELKNHRLKMFLGNDYNRIHKPSLERKRQIETGIIKRLPKNSKRRRDFKEKVHAYPENNQLKSHSHSINTSDDTVYLISNVSLKQRKNSKISEVLAQNNNMFITPTCPRKGSSSELVENAEICATDLLLYEDEGDSEYERNEFVSPKDHLYTPEYTHEEGIFHNNYENTVSRMPHLYDETTICCEMGGFQIRITPMESSYRYSKEHLK